MIEELPQAVGQYQFAHRLAQETLIQELSLTMRVRLHARIGLVLEELHGTNAEAHAAELAYHFSQAETVTGTEKLVQYSLLAGEQALGAYAFEEAMVHFQRALTSKEDQEVDAETAAVLFGLGRAQTATGGRILALQVRDSLRRAFEYYAGAGDVDRAVAVAEFPVQASLGVATGATELISRALELVPTDSYQAGRLLSTYGLTLYKETGDYEKAQDAFKAALSIAQREQDPSLEMRTLAGAAEAARWQLSLMEAVDYGQRAVELTSQIDDPRSEILARLHMGFGLSAMGDHTQAQLNCAAILTTAERLRDPGRLNDAIARNAELCFLEGKWQDARTYGRPRGRADRDRDPVDPQRYGVVGVPDG